MALVGTIRQGTLANLLESFKRTRVLASLTIKSGEREGLLSFAKGELKSCALGEVEGWDALEEMLRWSHGQFTLRILDSETHTEDLAARGAHVMVVDDELGVRKLIESFLEAEGYRVSVVSQASQAVNLVEYCKPDLVLLDVMLTGIDGFELAELLGQQYASERLPIVMMSANHDYKIRSEELGLPFFGKPFDFKALCAKISELVGAPEDRPASASKVGKAAPGQPTPAKALSSFTLLARLATFLDAESFLPEHDQCFVLDEVARAKIALAQADPALASLLAGFDGFQTLGQYLSEDPDSREERVLVTLFLLAVDALHRADSSFGSKGG
ncbi:MAG: response regulator [Polyangia bacterium]|jgi:two-component system alkaline phosphatase synthesis response regulator PhoP|nr:response regulator [Polyangia bacterium]